MKRVEDRVRRSAVELLMRDGARQRQEWRAFHVRLHRVRARQRSITAAQHGSSCFDRCVTDSRLAHFWHAGQ